MEDVTLYELISLIERGTNLHIGAVFLGEHSSKALSLPDSHTIHSKPVCEIFKSTQKGISRCMKCRNYVLKKVIRDKLPIYALCINGVFEYTHPIIVGQRVVAVVFIGNILTDSGKEKLEAKSPGYSIPYESMAYGFGIDECKKIAKIIEEHTLILLEKYPSKGDSKSAIIDNIKSYVLSNLEYDHTLSEISSLFFYNEAYLGRLFLRETGESFKDYLNKERVSRAKLLLRSALSVTEVAERVGYNSVAYFNRIFKKLTGYTPSEYRKSVT